MGTHSTRYPAEVRNRAVRLVLDHQGAHASQSEAGRGRHGAFGRQRGRQLRQRARNGLYKAEVVHRCGPWRSFEAVEFAALEWVDRFNNRRHFEPIGNTPPAEAEARHYAMPVEPALAA